MKKIIIALVVLIVASLLTFYLVFNNNSIQSINTSYQSTTTQTVNNPVTPTSSEAIINISNFAFNPSTMTIKAGTKVTWTNNDSIPHQVKGDILTSLSAPVMNNGQMYSYAFNDVGTFSYHCIIHPMMKGEIIVIK